MKPLAETIIGLLLEDRLDDIIKKYPKMKLNRIKLEQWLEFDPTNNKKYFPWIVRQVAEKKAKLPKDGERIRDNLMRFERLLVIPAFKGSRDIFQYDFKSLDQAIRASGELQSKTEQEREARNKGVKVVGQSGAIQVVEIKNSQELVNRAREAYSKKNPNWKGAKKEPEAYQKNERFGDGLWCVRFMEYATSYLAGGPFYLVYKNGGPYVGIVFERGECQTLDNQPIDLGIAEEIYPALKPILDAKAQEGAGLERNCSIFVNMRFLNGEAKDGETASGLSGLLDLSFSSLSRLPNNLTVKGTLDITGCPIAQLPAGLAIKDGKLKLAGTGITTLPPDLEAVEMEWSEPLTQDEMRKQFYRQRLRDMKKHFWQSNLLYIPELGPDGKPLKMRRRDPKTGQDKLVAKPKLGPDGQPIWMTDEQKEEEWMGFQGKLMDHFAHSQEIADTVKNVYKYVPATSIKRGRNSRDH